MSNQQQELLLDRYHQPRFAGPLATATHWAEGSNPVCGDEIRWEVQIKDDRLVALRHQCRGCSICTASADFLAEALTDQPTKTIEQWGSPEINQLIQLPLSPIRLKCALLPLETLRGLEQA